VIDRLASAVRSMLTRGKVTRATVGARTLLQVTGLDGETIEQVEHLMPPGYSARPAVGADVLLMQVCGSRDHLVALGGDATGNAIANLALGEVGLTAFGNQVVLRTDHVEVTTTGSAAIAITAGGTISLTAGAGAINLNAPGGVIVNGVTLSVP
jgi:phage baseplate assembly protein V